ncbi:MAG: hypothetical protein WC810_02945 [Janthinobacterium sp.]|jgi:hypothetical protein
MKDIKDKLLSARFLMAVAYTLTYCSIMVLLTIALLQKIVNVETYVALLAAFALIVREIAGDYFSRQDRSKPKGDNDEPNPENKKPV